MEAKVEVVREAEIEMEVEATVNFCMIGCGLTSNMVRLLTAGKGLV